MGNHSPFAPSSAHRWLRCPGSIELSKKYETDSGASEYAAEGVLAHDLAEKTLESELQETWAIDGDYQLEMRIQVQKYVDYVLGVRENCRAHTVFGERKLTLADNPVLHGTIDCLIIAENELHYIDLKYGKGVEVSAEENEQLGLYAILSLGDKSVGDVIGSINKDRKIFFHIVQPRIENYSVWEVPKEWLEELNFRVYELVLRQTEDKLPLVPGEKQCRFCPAKQDCVALYNYTSEILETDFNDDFEEKNADTLSDEQRKKLLDAKTLIINFLEANEKKVYDILLNGGEFAGYKLVEGRSIRKWNDNAETELLSILGEEAYEKKLIGITKAEKLMDKKQVNKLTIKPQGRPTLAPENDKRKKMELENYQTDFESAEGENENE